MLACHQLCLLNITEPSTNNINKGEEVTNQRNTDTEDIDKLPEYAGIAAGILVMIIVSLVVAVICVRNRKNRQVYLH